LKNTDSHVKDQSLSDGDHSDEDNTLVDSQSPTGSEVAASSTARPKTREPRRRSTGQSPRSEFSGQDGDEKDAAPTQPSKARRKAGGAEDKVGKDGGPIKDGQAPPTYPPIPNTKGSKSTQADEKPLPSLLSIRPIFSGLWRYTMAAKILSLLLVLQIAVAVMGGRQITALVNLPSGGATDSTSLAKRAANEELPFDIRCTQKWLAKMFGGQPDPILVLTLMFTWVSMSILMSGVIYNAIIEKTESTPVVLTEEEKKAKWYNHKKDLVKKLGRKMKSSVISVVRLILMDRHPSVRLFWTKLGRWTALRIVIFTVQLLIAIVVVRHVLAMASLAAGAETPIPSGLEIPLTLELLKKALPMIQPYPGGMMLLVAFVLTAVIIIVPVGWHSLLHPRQKNPESRTAGQTMKRILTCQAFGKGISLGRFRKPVVILLGMFLVACFGACLYYFVEIMKYIGEVGFVKDSGYMDSVGLVGASMIFGIFALPLAYIAFECEDAVRSVLKNRASKKVAGAQ